MSEKHTHTLQRKNVQIPVDPHKYSQDSSKTNFHSYTWLFCSQCCIEYSSISINTDLTVNEIYDGADILSTTLVGSWAVFPGSPIISGTDPTTPAKYLASLGRGEQTVDPEVLGFYRSLDVANVMTMSSSHSCCSSSTAEPTWQA